MIKSIHRSEKRAGIQEFHPGLFLEKFPVNKIFCSNFYNLIRAIKAVRRLILICLYKDYIVMFGGKRCFAPWYLLYKIRKK